MTPTTALTLPSRVIAACEQLGDAASGRKVRTVLGGGSLRDITPLVTEWKRRLGVDTRDGRQHSALEAAHARNALLDRLARTLTVPGNGPTATPLSPTPDAPAALRDLWRADVASLRNDVAQLARTVTAAAIVAQTRAEPPPVVAIEPRPGRELNAALEHIDARLSALEASIETHASPARAVASAVHALVDRLDVLSNVVQRLAGEAATSVADHHRLADGLHEHLASLADGQEALASTVGFCAAGAVAPVLTALDRLDRRQAARLQRLRARSPTSSPPPRKKKKRHVR